jgi:hypothetical protein
MLPLVDVSAYNLHPHKFPSGCITHSGDANNEVGAALTEWGKYANIQDCGPGNQITYTLVDGPMYPGTTVRAEANANVVNNVTISCAITADRVTGIRFETTIHEVGHCLGLRHSDDPSANMTPKCCNPINSDDIAGIRALYPYPVTSTPTSTPRPTITPSPSATPTNVVPFIPTSTPTYIPTMVPTSVPIAPPTRWYRLFVPAVAYR